MSKSKAVVARATGVLAAAALAVGMVAVASPAYAADLGTLTLSPESGSISANPALVSATSSAACPTGYGTNATIKVGRVGAAISTFGNLNAIQSDPAGYSAAPFTLTTNRSLARGITGSDTGTVAAGDYDIIVICSGDVLGDHADVFRTTITVTGTTWAKKVAPVAQATATVLSILPAGPVDAGTNVTLTATVSPAAAGSVEFRRGATVIGTAPVAAGVAALTVNTLPVGAFNITAVFDSTDNAAFLDSTSAPVAFSVEAPDGIVTAVQEITADVAPGAFTLTVAAPTVALTGGTVGGQATGALSAATVVDLRGSTAGWSLSGQVEDFAAGTSFISGNNLGWVPSATKVSGSGAVVAGPTALAGATTGLGGAARTLCTAVGGASAGTFTCNAGLTLVIPDNAAPGAYAATLTLTLA